LPERDFNLETLERESHENPYVSKFEEFFGSVYKKQIELLVGQYPQKHSLMVDFKQLERFDIELADALLDEPDILLEAASMAVEKIDVPALEITEFKPHVRFFNLPADREPLIMNIGAEHLGKLIAVEGIIAQITDVLPKLKIAVWQCRRCGNTYKILQDKQELKMPDFCECRHRDFVLVPEKSHFIDFQKIKIQESLEKLKGNEQAAYVDIYVSEDLVNRVNVGAKIKFCGILRLMQVKDGKTVYGRFLEAHHIEETEKEFSEVEITPEEEKEIKKFAADPLIYEKLVRSIAPAIYGHEVVKEAIALQLFGGVKKTLPGDAHVRGNIHVLLVGDPGMAKSQLLQAAHNIAPKSIYVAGKTTSGVGLTATAVKDDFGEGGWTLKAGALVLSSGGMCMTDELDKMEAEERSALHEAMEQGMISVAKAGIVTRFRADTSILAAANPKFARFDQYQPFIQQVDLPPTLISRFDLFFMIKDVLDRTKDEKIAEHILKTHRVGEMISQQKRKGTTTKNKEIEELKKAVTPEIMPELLKKYISYTRQNIFPTLTSESIKLISDFYVELRDMGRKEGSYSATHRQLEGLVRLSEASARIRLSDTVEEQDAQRAIRLVKNSLEDVVTDPETGKIDYDIIVSGQTHTKLNNMKKILNIIKLKAQEMEMVPMDDVIAEAAKEKIDEEKVKDILAELEKKGEIYKPRYHFVKPSQKSS